MYGARIGLLMRKHRSELLKRCCCWWRRGKMKSPTIRTSVRMNVARLIPVRTYIRKTRRRWQVTGEWTWLIDITTLPLSQTTTSLRSAAAAVAVNAWFDTHIHSHTRSINDPTRPDRTSCDWRLFLHLQFARTLHHHAITYCGPQVLSTVCCRCAWWSYFSVFHS